MPKPHDPSEEALRRLDKDLETFEAKRAAPATMFSAAGGINEGYRLLAGLLGGVFGGVGLGLLCLLRLVLLLLLPRHLTHRGAFLSLVLCLLRQ